MANLRKIHKNKIAYYLYTLLVFCTFLSYLYIVPTYFKPQFLIISIISVFLICLLKSNMLKKESILFIILFSFLVLSSSFININDAPNLTRIILLSAIYPLSFFTCISLFKSNSIFKMVAPFFVCIIVIVVLSFLSISGIHKFEFYNTSADILDYYSDRETRYDLSAVTGIYLNQNSLGAVLITGIYSSLILFFCKETKLNRTISSILFISSISMLLLTLARAPILAVLLGLVFYLTLAPIKRYFKIIILILFLLGGLLFFMSDYAILFSEKLSNAGLSNRDVIWGDALEKLGNNKIAGVGLGNYYFTDGYSQFSTHNVYLFFMVSLGLFGSFGVFCFLFYYVFIPLFKTISYKHNVYYVVFSSAIITVLLHQFFEVNLDNPLRPISLLFILCVSYLHYFRKTN